MIDWFGCPREMLKGVPSPMRNLFVACLRKIYRGILAEALSDKIEFSCRIMTRPTVIICTTAVLDVLPTALAGRVIASEPSSTADLG